MSFRHVSTKWPLLEKLPSGLIKDNLIEIKEHLDKIDQVCGVLGPLSDFERETEQQTVTLSNDTIMALMCIIDSNVDSVFHHLNQIFEPRAAAQGGEA